MCVYEYVCVRVFVRLRVNLGVAQRRYEGVRLSVSLPNLVSYRCVYVQQLQVYLYIAAVTLRV